MPMVRVALMDGRTPEQKQEVATAIAEALERIAGAPQGSTHVIFENVQREDWVRPTTGDNSGGKN